jgi:hypothetical protein
LGDCLHPDNTVEIQCTTWEVVTGATGVTGELFMGNNLVKTTILVFNLIRKIRNTFRLNSQHNKNVFENELREER